jgi:hypothetical protein
MSGWLLPPSSLLDLVQELSDLSVEAIDEPPQGGVPMPVCTEDLALRLRERFGIAVDAAELSGLDTGSILDLIYHRMS